MGELSHTETQELLGAYALDAVSREEAEAIDQHLKVCPRCRSEVDAHREVAAFMAQAGSSAPEELWSRIAANLEEAPPKLELAKVAPIESARRSPVFRLLAGVAAAVLIAGLGVQVVRQEERIDDLRAAVDRRPLHRAATVAMTDRTTRRVDLRSDDGGTFVQTVLESDGTGYVVQHNLPRLPAGRTYQLWARLGDSLVSVGVLGPQPELAAFKIDRDPAMLAVTAEPAGGVAAPTLPPLVRAVVVAPAVGR